MHFLLLALLLDVVTPRRSSGNSPSGEPVGRVRSVSYTAPAGSSVATDAGSNYVANIFDFAGIDGRGMTAACACTNPTSADGGTLTFTRASSAWCSKGNEWSSIATGDLVECATNQPRIMPGGDGTGGLGLAVFTARTNNYLYSQQFDNAATSKIHVVVADPIVTADYALGPDNAMTADRVQFAATSVIQVSALTQSVSLSGAASAGVYIKGTSGSGTIDIGLYDNGGVAYVCALCSYNATTWTRCRLENVATGAANGTILIGNNGLYCGLGAHDANDVLLWQADWQLGPALAPPVTTTTVAATSAADVASFAISPPASPNTRCMGATVVLGSAALANQQTVIKVRADASNSTSLEVLAGKAKCTWTNAGSSVNTTTAASFTANAANRIASYYDGTDRAVCIDGTCVTAATSMTLFTGDSTAWTGLIQTPGLQMNAVLKRFFVDTDPTKCQ